MDNPVDPIQEFQVYAENREWLDHCNPYEVGADHAHQLLGHILGNAIQEAGIRGDWSIQAESAAGRLVEATVDSVRSKLGLGIWGWEISLCVDLSYPERIRDMGDEFWAEVATLHKHGKASFKGNLGITGRGTPADKSLCKKNKSLVFSLVRECILLEQEWEGNGSLCDLTDAYTDFGRLELIWPVDAPAKGLRESLREGVRGFCRIAYLLYRAAYLAEHSKSRRAIKIHN